MFLTKVELAATIAVDVISCAALDHPLSDTVEVRRCEDMTVTLQHRAPEAIAAVRAALISSSGDLDA